MYAYIKLSGRFNESFLPWQSETLNWKAIRHQFKFTVVMASIDFLDYFYFGILMIMGGSFGTKDSVVNLALQQTSAIIYYMFVGISQTGVVYVANSVGEQHPNKAKNYGQVAFYVVYAIVALFILLFILFGQNWVELWVVEPETQLYTLKVFNLYTFIKLPGTALVWASLITLKGCEKQRLAAITAVIIDYFVGLPAAWLLAFKFDMKVYGIWLSVTMIAWILGINYQIQIWRLDWEDVIHKAQKEISKSSKKLE